MPIQSAITSKLFIRIIIGITIVVVLILGYSVIRSGIFYQYDVDELAHTQFVYLIAKGFDPYRSFHMIFTPVFSLFQMPVYTILGFNFQSVFTMRIVMSIVFIVRLLFSFLFIKSVFGKKAALLFVPLLLLDPFTTFSGMQIRPDNLMTLFFLVGLVLFSYAVKNKSRFLIFLTGIFLSLSSITLIKILPAVAVIIILFLYDSYRKRDIKKFLILLLGYIIPWIVLLGYFVFAGMFSDFFRNVFFYALLNSKTILNVTPITFYFLPDNIYIYGVMGKPANWVYVYVFHLMGLLGIIITVVRLRKRIIVSREDVFLKILSVLLCIVLAIWVFTVKGAFVHYFLPLSLLLGLFSAVFLEYTGEYFHKKSQTLYYIVLLIGMGGLILFSQAAIQGNIARANIRNPRTIAEYEDSWKFIPESEATFPNQLFRPFGYPLTYGTFIGDVHPRILRDWGRVEDHLETGKVKYVFKSDYLWQYLDPGTKEYIESHYSPSSKEGILYIKE